MPHELMFIFLQSVFSLLYKDPIFLLFIIWIFCRVREGYEWRLWAPLLDALVIGTAVSRFFGSAIPPSGHALFLTYSLLTVKNRLYRIGALTLLLVVVTFKVRRGDYQSWAYGIVIGAICGLIWAYILNKRGRAIRLGEEQDRA